jgi:hypothetical protein
MKEKRKERNGPVRPSVFHRNSACIEYFDAETNFIVENVFTSATKRKIKVRAAKQTAYLQDPTIPAVYKLSPSYYYRDQIARCIDGYSALGINYRSEVVNYLVQAVRQFGVDALRLNASDKWRIRPLSRDEMNRRWAEINERFADVDKLVLEALPETGPQNAVASGRHGIQLKRLANRNVRSLDEEGEDSSAWTAEFMRKPERKEPLAYLHRVRAQQEAELFELRYREGLGRAICDVLRFWREQIKAGSLGERQQAIKHLKAFGKALIPEARGKRQNTRIASAYEVKKFYLQELYRLYHVKHAVGSYDGPRNFSLKVKQASENYGLAIESIREFLGLDEDDKPDRQRFTPKDMARELAARKFKITHPTVSNLLSS